MGMYDLYPSEKGGSGRLVFSDLIKKSALTKP